MIKIFEIKFKTKHAVYKHYQISQSMVWRLRKKKKITFEMAVIEALMCKEFQKIERIKRNSYRFEKTPIDYFVYRCPMARLKVS